MAEGPSGSGFFGFIDILKGLPVVPKIIMFVGLLALIAGFFSGPFALFHNSKISVGTGLMLASLSWRDWEQTRWHNPSPPYEGHWDFARIFWGLVFGGFAVWMFRVCYLSAK
jgi:hypothetical protein